MKGAHICSDAAHIAGYTPDGQFDGGPFKPRGCMVPILVGGFAHVAERARHLFPIVATLLLFLLLVAGLASTYVGHARSPYNGCQGANGRAVSCAILEALR